VFWITLEIDLWHIAERGVRKRSNKEMDYSVERRGMLKNHVVKIKKCDG